MELYCRPISTSRDWWAISVAYKSINRTFQPRGPSSAVTLYICASSKHPAISCYPFCYGLVYVAKHWHRHNKGQGMGHVHQQILNLLHLPCFVYNMSSTIHSWQWSWVQPHIMLCMYKQIHYLYQPNSVSILLGSSWHWVCLLNICSSYDVHLNSLIEADKDMQIAIYISLILENTLKDAQKISALMSNPVSHAYQC